MNAVENFKARTKQFIKDKTGGFSMMFAIASSLIIVVVGSAYDLGQLTKAKQLAQFSADTMALTASVAVNTDNPDRYVEGESYTYDQLGGPAKDFTNSMVGGIEYDIVDDLDPANANLEEGEQSKLIARATVTGQYKPAFMAIAGFDAIKFRAISDVSYTSEKGAPASVFFIVDNSGSMGDDDSAGTKKIDSLESSMTDFMATLRALDSENSDVFRTAMYPYSADPHGYYASITSDGVIPSHVIQPAWGTISDNYITRMYDRHGTDSSGALEDAAAAFESENAVHLATNQEADPLKYAVFMTDGANNPSCENYQYGQIEGPFYYRFNNGKVEKSAAYIEGWSYFSGGLTNNSYNYCTMDYWFNQRSLTTCSEMKEDGVEIFAIAYDIDADQKAIAEDFMEECSSGEEYFFSASNASEMDLAFTQISDSIVSDVIRIKR